MIGKTKTGILSLLSAPLLSACGAIRAPLVITSGGSATFRHFLYTANNGTNTVSAIEVNPTTGSLTTIQDYVAGNAPENIIVDPESHFVYCANMVENTVSVFRIAKDGTLTKVTDLASPGTPRGLAILPNGKYLYVTNYAANTVSEYSLDSSGIPVLIGSVAAGTGPKTIAVDPAGKFLYVAERGANDVRSYRVNPDGTLTSVSTSAAGFWPVTVAVNSTGNAIYVATVGTDLISYAVDPVTGVLAAGVVTGTATQPNGLSTDPLGRFVVSGNWTGKNTTLWSPAGGGLMTDDSDFAGPDVFSDAIFHPSGAFVFSAVYGTNQIFSLAVNRSGAGSLSVVDQATVGSNPNSVAIGVVKQ